MLAEYIIVILLKYFSNTHLKLHQHASNSFRTGIYIMYIIVIYLYKKYPIALMDNLPPEQ